MSIPGLDHASARRRTAPIASIIVFGVLTAAGVATVLYAAAQVPAEGTTRTDLVVSSPGWVLLAVAAGLVVAVFGILLSVALGRGLAHAIESARGDTFLGLPRPLARWLLPLLLHLALVVAVITVLTLLLDTMQAADPADLDQARSGLAAASLHLALLPVCGALIILLFVRTIGGARASRRMHGGIPRAAGERGGREAERQRAQAAMSRAVEFRRTLIERRVPESIAVWDFPAREGEVFFADGPATYARYYGPQRVVQHRGRILLRQPPVRGRRARGQRDRRRVGQERRRARGA